MSDTVVVKLNRASRMALPSEVPGQLVLLPGENNVDAAAWKKLRKHATIKLYMEPGKNGKALLEELDKDEASPIADQLSTIPDQQARMWIEAEKDMGQLQRWRDNETRDSVRDLIAARMEQLEAHTAGDTAAEQGGN